jgi:hypothetical protein
MNGRLKRSTGLLANLTEWSSLTRRLSPVWANQRLTRDRQLFLQFPEKGIIIDLLQRHRENLKEAPEWMGNLVLEEKSTSTLAIHDKQELSIAGTLSVWLCDFIVCHRWRLYRECTNEGPHNQMKDMSHMHTAQFPRHAEQSTKPVDNSRRSLWINWLPGKNFTDFFKMLKV